MIWHLLYLLACAAMALSIPGDVFASAGGFLLIVGVVGLWRYSWGLVNFARAIFYIYWAYPRRKAAAEQVYAASPHRAHAFFLTTTFKIETAITTKVYRSIFLAASRSQGGATVVASVVDSADERLIRCLHAAAPAGVSPVKLIIDRIPGTGKRDALATSLRTIAGQCPTKRDIVLFVDGDSCVPEDVVARTAPFFAVEGTGALTTDEACEIPDNELFRDWYALRFTQRQMMMSAVALGHRVLTLTGRMSVVRADLATQPDFIASIEHDSIDHWRLGTVKFLTGDDKSTWFWLLKNGYRMAYLPDLQAVSMETQPKRGFRRFRVDADGPLVRQHASDQRTRSEAISVQDRLVHLVVDPGSTHFHVDNPGGSDQRGHDGPSGRTDDSAGLRRLGHVNSVSLLLAVGDVRGAVSDQLSLPRLFRPGLRGIGEELCALPPRPAEMDPTAHGAAERSRLAGAAPVPLLRLPPRVGLQLACRLHTRSGRFQSSRMSTAGGLFQKEILMASTTSTGPTISTDPGRSNRTTEPVRDFAGVDEHPVLRIPFTANLDGRTYEGAGLSIVGASVKGLAAPHLGGQMRLATLQFHFEGYVLSLLVSVRIEAASSELGMLSLRFLEPTGAHLPQLRYLLNAYVAGEVVEVDGLLDASVRRSDAARIQPKSIDGSLGRRLKRLVGGAVIALASALSWESSASDCTNVSSSLMPTVFRP